MKEITLDSSKTLKLADKKQALSCDTHSELLLIQALQRRALTLDLVGAASYAEVQKYNTFLTMHLQTPPPPGYVFFFARSCLGKVPGRASFSQLSQQATACTIRKLSSKLTKTN